LIRLFHFPSARSAMCWHHRELEVFLMGLPRCLHIGSRQAIYMHSWMYV